MGITGAVPIQGCAFRIGRLQFDGSIIAGDTVGMVADDKPLVKFSAKPNNEAGVEMNPKSACGDLLASYKDFDRTKRWDCQLDLGDVDFDKFEIIGGGDLITAASMTGRVFADGVTVENSTTLTSPSLALFVPTDVGRSVVGTGIDADTFIVRVIDNSRTVTDGVTVSTDATVTSATAAFTAADIGKVIAGTGITPGTTIASINSTTSIEMSATATGSATGVTLVIGSTAAVLNHSATADGTAVSITLGAIPSRTIGYEFPALLGVDNPDGISLEIWQKALVRGTGYQGTTPYPYAGSTSPALPPSAWFRWGFFRLILKKTDTTIEGKESMASWSGWGIENPMFGLGPALDWTDTADPGGVPVNTTRWCNVLMDHKLPTTLGPGYQTTAS